MKLMIFAIDALPPDIVFKEIDKFPNIKRLKNNGMYCEYDTYTYGYGSSDNWITLYTGLTPQQHGSINNRYRNENRKPNTYDYNSKEPFWRLFSNNDISIGMWKGLNTTPPENINGYMISGEMSYEINEIEDEYYNTTEQVVCDKDKYILNFINGSITRQPIPKSIEDLGYSWSYVKSNPEVLDNILKDDYFSDGVQYLKDNLEYYKNNILNVQKNSPVDVGYFYTPLIDYIGHFQLHDLDKKQMIEAIKLIDKFIGDIISIINPDNIIVLSDHGIKGWNECFKNSPEEIQREMFGFRDDAVWLKNGSIVINGRNKGILSACHAIKGTFIISGKGIKKGKINEMRTVDFYPTLLEMFNINVPQNRSGYVLDVFSNKDIVNKKQLISRCQKDKSKIAIIQNIDIPDFNRVINEVFLSNRFSSITILGELRYKDAFICNPRVNDFISIDNKILDKNMFNKFDKVIISYKNTMTKKVDFYEVF